VAEALDRDDIVGQAFNIAAGAPATVIEIVRAIADLMGGKLPQPRLLGVARDEIREQRLSTDKVRRIVGWTSKVGLTEGLRDTIGWYRSYLGDES
jgi:nucleoside-diphosphate-sugar epimerase